MEVTKILIIPFLLLKSLFMAIAQVAFGLASMMGLNLLLTYLVTANKMDPLTQIDPLFLKAELFIFHNLMGFVIIFIIIYFYFDLKEVIKE